MTEMLVAAGAELTFRTPPEARHLIGFSAVDYAVGAGDGNSTPVVGACCVAESDSRPGARVLRLCRLAGRGARDHGLGHVCGKVKIHPTHERGTVAMVAAGVPMGEMVHGSAGTPLSGAEPSLYPPQETEKAEAIVCTYDVFHADDVYESTTSSTTPSSSSLTQS